MDVKRNILLDALENSKSELRALLVKAQRGKNVRDRVILLRFLVAGINDRKSLNKNVTIEIGETYEIVK